MVEEIRFRNLSEYVAAIRELTGRWRTHPGDIWYRGVDDDQLRLVPGSVWRQIDFATEESMVAEFLIYYRCYYPKAPRGLELYVLMRHYGLPTRLLDWSMSALVSLFFALERPESAGRRPVVWAMDQAELNRIALGQSGAVMPQVTPARFIEAWLPPLLRDQEPEREVPEGVFAFKHPLSNPRIHAQKGCFTFHGRTQEPLETIFQGAGSDRLVRLVLADPQRRQAVLGELFDLGYKEDDIYQDLSSLARRIVREHGFTPC